MKAEERFILVKVYIDNSTKAIIGDLNSVCDEIEKQIIDNHTNALSTKKMVVYDRKYSTSDKELDCWQEVGDTLLYNQFLDSYYGDEEV